jgi:hypothetical protein
VPCAPANPGSREVPATNTVTNIRRIMLMMSLKHHPAIPCPAITKTKRRNSDRKDKTDKAPAILNRFDPSFILLIPVAPFSTQRYS